MLFPPAIFFIRRLTFSIAVVYGPKHFWAMVGSQFAISIAVLIFVIHSRPFDTKLAFAFEVFNELTTFFVLYMILCFSDFVP